MQDKKFKQVVNLNSRNFSDASVNCCMEDNIETINIQMRKSSEDEDNIYSGSFYAQHSLLKQLTPLKRHNLESTSDKSTPKLKNETQQDFNYLDFASTSNHQPLKITNYKQNFPF